MPQDDVQQVIEGIKKDYVLIKKGHFFGYLTVVVIGLVAIGGGSYASIDSIVDSAVKEHVALEATQATIDEIAELKRMATTSLAAINETKNDSDAVLSEIMNLRNALNDRRIQIGFGEPVEWTVGRGDPLTIPAESDGLVVLTGGGFGFGDALGSVRSLRNDRLRASYDLDTPADDRSTSHVLPVLAGEEFNTWYDPGNQQPDNIQIFFYPLEVRW